MDWDLKIYLGRRVEKPGYLVSSGLGMFLLIMIASFELLAMMTDIMGKIGMFIIS